MESLIFGCICMPFYFVYVIRILLYCAGLSLVVLIGIAIGK